MLRRSSDSRVPGAGSFERVSESCPCAIVSAVSGGEGRGAHVPVVFDNVIAKGLDLEDAGVFAAGYARVRGPVLFLLKFATHLCWLVGGCRKVVVVGGFGGGSFTLRLEVCRRRRFSEIFVHRPGSLQGWRLGCIQPSEELWRTAMTDSSDGMANKQQQPFTFLFAISHHITQVYAIQKCLLNRAHPRNPTQSKTTSHPSQRPVRRTISAMVSTVKMRTERMIFASQQAPGLQEAVSYTRAPKSARSSPVLAVSHSPAASPTSATWRRTPSRLQPQRCS